MAMRRRTFLNLGTAGALGVGVSMLGAGQAHAEPAPANPFTGVPPEKGTRVYVV